MAMGTAGDGQRSERDYVRSDGGRKSYDVGRRFLEQAGLEGRLDSNSNACTHPYDSEVIFDLSREGSLYVIAHRNGNKATITYEYSFSDPIDDTKSPISLQTADLLRVLQKLCISGGYGIEVKEELHEVKVNIAAEGADNTKLAQFAICVGHVDWLISTYSGNQK